MTWCWWRSSGSLLVDERFVVLECLAFSAVGWMVAIAVDALRCAFACCARAFAFGMGNDAFNAAGWSVAVT